jgi:DNA-binding CsgD family transcriptional regulator
LVAELVIDGLTNREAGHNFLSPHTVGFHLRQIYRKLDARSRAELARLAAPPGPRPLPAPVVRQITPA